MCGIAGYVSINKKVTDNDLKHAANLLAHRGPDADGIYFSDDKKIGLAHRRLSILDLSTAANQPMFSADGRYCIVFNGEIYNFRELAQQLPCKGTSLRTTSDTEVILSLFEQTGTDSFAAMNGMFAFAIYDLQKQELTLCRDHVGIKPLFVYQDKSTLVFASELKVIRSLMGDALSINPEAIPYFLHLGFIPEPLSIYQGTSKFPAGHFVQLRVGDSAGDLPVINAKPFWKLGDHVDAYTLSNEPAAKKQLTNLLNDSIEKQLISDVPIGTFLSGGIDSSLVTAIASKLTGTKQIKTFSIAIDEGKFDESNYARQVANHLKTDHHEFHVKEHEVIELVDRLLPAYDEPFADASAFPTMMVSRLARKHVTVALTGDGGDELFHGYGMYSWAKRLSHPVADVVKAPIFSASRFLNSRYQRIGDMFGYGNRNHLITHVFSQEQYYFREEELGDLLIRPSQSFDAINDSPKLARQLSGSERQSFWDFNHYLKDDLLVKVDRASMQFSLESRVPLLDYRLVEFAFNLDESLKVKEGSMKYLLKEVLYDHVPRQIFDRPKWGFGIPLAKWLKTDLKFLLDKYTEKAVIEKYNLLNFPAVHKLKVEYLRGKAHLFNRLWLVIVLHWWLEENLSLTPSFVNE